MIADIFEAVAERAELDGVELMLGGEFLDIQTTAARIVWVPTADSFRPGRIQAGLTPGDLTKPKSVGTRIAGVRCRVWAKADGAGNVADSVAEVRALEQLVERLVLAVHACCYGSFAVVALEWLDQDGAPLLQYGRACDVSFTFEVPIARAVAQGGYETRPVTAIENTAVLGEMEETWAIAPVTLEVAPSTASVNPDETVQLTAMATYADGSTADVTGVCAWSSADEDVASVAGGLVTGIESDILPVEITAALRELTALAEVSVT